MVSKECPPLFMVTIVDLCDEKKIKWKVVNIKTPFLFMN